jgi:hypothetical protein
MSTRRTLLKLAALAVVGTTAAPALADDTGFASMHDMRREKGRLCFTDHFHYGSGAGVTKAAAQKDAISSWQSFTAFEYGTDWASFRKAAGKGVSCSSGGSGFDCQVQARPCK